MFFALVPDTTVLLEVLPVPPSAVRSPPESRPLRPADAQHTNSTQFESARAHTRSPRVSSGAVDSMTCSSRFRHSGRLLGLTSQAPTSSSSHSTCILLTPAPARSDSQHLIARNLSHVARGCHTRGFGAHGFVTATSSPEVSALTVSSLPPHHPRFRRSRFRHCHLITGHLSRERAPP